MGLFSYEFEDRGARRVTLYAWLAAPLLLVGFLITRHMLAGPRALLLSQVLFVGSAAAAFVTVGLAIRRADKGTRSRLVWVLMALALGLLTISESVYAIELVTSGPGEMAAAGFADYLNTAAALVFIGMLAAGASVDRLGRLSAARLVVDVVATSALFFALLFRISVVQVVSSGTPVEVFEAVRYAVYAAVGFLILAGDGLLFLTLPLRRFQPWDRLLGLGIGSYGLGVALWPVWSLALAGRGLPDWIEAAVNALFLSGYLLIALAGLQRLLASEVPWRDWYVARSEPSWLGQAVVTVVFVSVVALAWWSATADRGSAEQRVYLSLLSVSAVALVAHTLLVSIETGRLQTRAWTDEVTGVGNVHALRRRVTQYAAATHRLEAPFVLAVVDLDGLGSLDVSHGREHRDGVLVAIAGALTSAETPGEAFRMAGNEFAVVLPDTRPDDAEHRGRSLAELVTAAAGKTAMSVSIGIAACPSCTTDADELLRCARDACQWAKRHGRARVAVYDQRLRAALAVDDRLRPSVGTSGVDMARALAAATDARDPANYHHSRNVAALSVLLAAEMGLDPDRIDRIQIAATLHDVGKIALPDAMLGGRIVAVKQRRIEREHSAMGQRLLESLGLEGVPEWVRSHHERWDGQGYPDGLTGEQIPLESRIIALADAYDGMTAGKRYGAPMSKAAALQEVDLGIGARFDPTLAEKFIQVVGSTSALGWSDGWPAA